MPLLAWGFDDDPMAPANIIDALIVQLPATCVIRRQANGAVLDVKGAGHMGFFHASLGVP